MTALYRAVLMYVKRDEILFATNIQKKNYKQCKSPSERFYYFQIIILPSVVINICIYNMASCNLLHG